MGKENGKKPAGKTVNLYEDMGSHKHDEKSYRKLAGVQKPKRDSKQSFSHAVKTGLYSYED